MSELLTKLQSLDQSPVCRYNIAVLLFFKENYGTALNYLTYLYESLECLSEYVAIKTIILLAETYLAMDMKTEIRQCIERLENYDVLSGILKNTPNAKYFAGLLVGA